jgi:hypothetical protein
MSGPNGRNIDARKTVLAFAALSEAATGVALLVVPSLGNCCSASN